MVGWGPLEFSVLQLFLLPPDPRMLQEPGQQTILHPRNPLQALQLPQSQGGFYRIHLHQ